MTNHAVLFRKSLSEEDEFNACSKFLPTFEFRTEIPSNSLVVGRYSCLPFYKELEDELKLKKSKLINNYNQHSFIADITSWSINGCLDGLTPKTWTEWGSLPEGSYVVKGRTNSRKHRWNTHMFAENKSEIRKVVKRLLDDSMISDQGLVVREYVPLKRLGTAINDLPITNEWRTFWLKDRMLAKGFYWSSHPEFSTESKWNKKAFFTAYEAAKKVSEFANFFVLDLAETKDGDWIIIEVNDGQMSGLSMINQNELYFNLSKELDKDIT